MPVTLPAKFIAEWVMLLAGATLLTFRATRPTRVGPGGSTYPAKVLSADALLDFKPHKVCGRLKVSLSSGGLGFSCLGGTGGGVTGISMLAMSSDLVRHSPVGIN